MKHPYAGQTVLFATKHGKEKILAPLFAQIDCNLIVASVDTDEFGTFSGEIERKGSIRETLLAKIKKAQEVCPGHRLYLASEGSFGPHPQLGLIPTDLESLLLFDSERDVGLSADYLSTEVVHFEREFGPSEDFRSYLRENGFPRHAVMVRPSGRPDLIFKGLQDEGSVDQAMLASFTASPVGRVLILSDLRACHNPTRQDAIRRAGVRLIEDLRHLCPRCSHPGFRIVEGIPGLPCKDCREPSRVAKSVLSRCVFCGHESLSPRPDGLQSIEPGECEVCNP